MSLWFGLSSRPIVINSMLNAIEEVRILSLHWIDYFYTIEYVIAISSCIIISTNCPTFFSYILITILYSWQWMWVQIQSYKFVPLVYQIASRMGGSKDGHGPNSFQVVNKSVFPGFIVLSLGFLCYSYDAVCFSVSCEENGSGSSLPYSFSGIFRNECHGKSC